MPGSKRVAGKGEPVGLRIPVAVYREVMEIIELEDRWPYPARQNFILEAIKEKVARWRAEGHRLPAGPGPAELGRGSKPRADR